jgi:hypothetical protein
MGTTLGTLDVYVIAANLIHQLKSLGTAIRTGYFRFQSTITPNSRPMPAKRASMTKIGQSILANTIAIIAKSASTPTTPEAKQDIKTKRKDPTTMRISFNLFNQSCANSLKFTI